MKTALITEEERRLISWRTRDALQAAKARGVKLGGLNAKGIQNRDEARQRAELLRPMLAELAGMTAGGIAREPNEREVPTPGGEPWHAMTVIRVQRLLSRPEVPPCRVLPRIARRLKQRDHSRKIQPEQGFGGGHPPNPTRNRYRISRSWGWVPLLVPKFVLHGAPVGGRRRAIGSVTSIDLWSDESCSGDVGNG